MQILKFHKTTTKLSAQKRKKVEINKKAKYKENVVIAVRNRQPQNQLSTGSGLGRASVERPTLTVRQAEAAAQDVCLAHCVQTFGTPF